MRPCWVAHPEALIVANNLDFLMAVVQAAQTRQNAMANEAFYRAADARLQKLGLARVLKDGAVASAFVYAPAVREGLEGFWRPLADKLTDNDMARQRLRAELEAEWRKAHRAGHRQRVQRRHARADRPRGEVAARPSPGARLRAVGGVRGRRRRGRAAAAGRAGAEVALPRMG